MGADGSSVAVAVGGTGVGNVRPGFVGGRVDVTKPTGSSVVAAWLGTLTQEAKRISRNREKLSFFVIWFLIDGVGAIFMLLSYHILPQAEIQTSSLPTARLIHK